MEPYPVEKVESSKPYNIYEIDSKLGMIYERLDAVEDVLNHAIYGNTPRVKESKTENLNNSCLNTISQCIDGMTLVLDTIERHVNVYFKDKK